jgi:hypothetical protein
LPNDIIMRKDIIDYSNTVFYKIYCNDTNVNDIYVGHTVNFVQRKDSHRGACIKENNANHNFKVYKCIRDNGGWDNWTMDMIGFQKCHNLLEAKTIEQQYYETLHATLNSIEPLPKLRLRPSLIPKEKKGKLENIKRKYNCEKCNFKCSKQSNFNKHLLSAKHKRLISTDENIPKNPSTYNCDCGKTYRHLSSLYKHKINCSFNENAIVIQENPEEKPSMMDIITHNKEIMSMLSKKDSVIDRLVLQNNDLMNTIKDMIPRI